MGVAALFVEACEFVMHEAALFAAFGFILLGASDLAVDFIWLAIRLKPARSAAPPPPSRPGRLAIFVPAWDEAAVIGAMLGHAQEGVRGRGLSALCRLLSQRSRDDRRGPRRRGAAGRLVIGPAPGPTSKADCLNRLWERMREDEAADGARFKAVVLHDAEDVVHSAELPLFDALIERHDLVQLPVLPLVDPRSRFVGGHYLDEFCEAHGKELVVRAAIGASLPSAGVGCADVSRGARGACRGRRRALRSRQPDRGL